MTTRECPHCRSELSAGSIAARSDSVDCPKCHARLEVASGPRSVATFCGLAAAAAAWWVSRNATGNLAAVLPTLYAVLGFGVVSGLVLMLTGTLRNAPAPPAAASIHDAHASGTPHH